MVRVNTRIKSVLRHLTTATILVAVVSCASQNQLSPISTPAPDQSDIVSTNLVIDTDSILRSHNSIRTRLGIPELRWSTRMQSYAAEWANYLSGQGNCIPRKRGMIGLARQKNGLGENIQLIEAKVFGDGRTEISPVDENQVVSDWVQQGVDFNYTNNQCAAGKTCENYTQVVWRDSKVVGCAAASCANNSQIWVCNYDPPGNFLGQKPY